MRTLLFSVTRKDLIITTFKGSRPGGQHRNKTETAVRIEHPASGAVSQASEFKSQLQNKKAALRRLTQTKEFQVWHKIEAARRIGETIKVLDWVEKMVRPGLYKVEKQVDGKWVEVSENDLEE